MWLGRGFEILDAIRAHPYRALDLTDAEKWIMKAGLSWRRHSALGAVIVVLAVGCGDINVENGSNDPDTGVTQDTATTDTSSVDTTTTDTTPGDTSIGDTATPDTTTGDTATPDTSTGVSCPVATHICVTKVPAGWKGPLAVYTGLASESKPGCGTGYPTSVHKLKSALNGGNAACDCSCGSPAGTKCDPVTFNNYGNISCGGTPFTTQLSGDFSANNCKLLGDFTQVFIGMAVSVNGGATSDPGSCKGTLSENIPAPNWDMKFQACSGEPQKGGCDVDQVCAPQIPSSFQKLCITQIGDVLCPSGPYKDRSVAYGSFQDSRACGACICGEPTGTCGGNVQFREGQCGLNKPWNTSPVGGCSPPVQGMYLFATYVPSSTASCSAGSPKITGSATATDATTVCCLP
jgi:hypothetical protein